MAKNVFTFYQTNEYMGMGFGYRTYGNLSDAMDAVGKTGVFGQRITEVYAVTCVDSKWWHGHYTGYLCETLSRGMIFSIN